MSANPNILGISAFYHDSAAALVSGSRIVAAAHEERFTRVKHDKSFPQNSSAYCLQEAGLKPKDINAIVFYDNPFLTWDRFARNNCQDFKSFSRGVHSILAKKIWIQDFIEKYLGKDFTENSEIFILDHHTSHAASSFYASPFDKASILTMDGVGEWASTTLGSGSGSNINISQCINFPNSLGLLYSVFTYYCGFKVNSGEYKLMGLAPYGKPIYYNHIRENLIETKEDGSYRLNQEYFNFSSFDKMIDAKFCSLMGGPARRPESRISSREMDLAASIQKVTEDIVLDMCKYLKNETGLNNLVMSGCVALNCVAIGKIKKSGIFENMWIQPASGDAGGALGAALFASHNYFKQTRKQENKDSMRGAYLGPSYSNDDIKRLVDRRKLVAKIIEPKDRAELIADQLSNKKIVGYFDGRMEYGPRALGARSILADPTVENAQTVINTRIKFRESFRPFAPIALEEEAEKYFDFEDVSPYMLYVALIKEEFRHYHDDDQDISEDLIKEINKSRSTLPAITHIDYSARLQTVSNEYNPKLYDVMKIFKEKTGIGVLVNTSFNVRGEPIVCTPWDAYKCFMRTEIDILVLEDYIFFKEDQPLWEEDDNWIEIYDLD